MSLPARKSQILFGILGILGFLLVGGYLLSLHYVQDYSDPIGFVIRAQQWATVGDHADRAPLYPVILYGLMQMLGQDWVFVANIPFILLLLVMLGVCTKSFFRDEHEWPTWVERAAVLLPGAVFFMVRSGLLQQMVNPYREPIALFALLSVAYLFVKGWRARRGNAILLGGVSGFLLGGATSIRETSLLLILALGVWGLREIWEHRKIPFGFCLVFGLGVLVGLLPLLIKNYQYSGSSLVPAYSANRVTHYSETGSWDIPIPGMSIYYFRATAPFTLRRTIEQYRWFGSAFFLIGLVAAFKRRNREVVYLYVPAFLAYFLFHCFYNRYLGRYLLTAEIFAVPVIAYGVILSWKRLESTLACRSEETSIIARKIIGLSAVAVFLMLFIPSLIRGNHGTKVWNLDAIRAEISEAIEKPAIFMGGRHFCYRMSWLLDQSFYEYTHRFQHDRRMYDSLEDRLRTHGQYTVNLFSEGSYYIDESHFALASNWLQRDPVFDFSDLSVPFERYGRPLSGNLYRVRLWQQNSTTLSGAERRPADAVLMLDLKRPWDYPERSFLRGWELSLPDIHHDLTNGVQFIELPREDAEESFSFQIESDAPLPKSPFWRIIGLDDDIMVSFGMRADNWSWHLADDSLYPNRYIPYDAGQLYDETEVRVPVFADPESDVYAEVRVEFLHEHPYWRADRHTVEITSPSNSNTWHLPPPRHQARYVILLGQGTGRLQKVPLSFRTSLPSHAEQNEPTFWREVRSNAFVKLYDIRVFSYRPNLQLPVALDIGQDDVHAVDRGFYDRERSGAHTGRWTAGTATLRLRNFSSRPEKIEVSVLPLVPPAHRADLIFSINGHSIAGGVVDVRQADGLDVYSFSVAPGMFDAEEDRFTLEIATETWNPAKAGIARDHRDLGVFVTGVTFQ